MGRENELYRDKIEVSLDGRQIFSLFFAGAVIVCTVFVIGVIVGKRVEARAHVDRAGSAAAGDPLAALDRLEADAPLSFRRTLRGGQAASGTVDAEIAAMASAQQAAQGESGKGQAHGVRGDESSDGDDAISAEQAADARSRANKTPEGKGDDERSGSLASAKAEAKEAEAKAKAEAKEAKEAEAKAKAEAKAEKPEAADKAGKDKKAKYTLQLSSFQERGEAETFLSELRAAGYTASVVAAEIEGKGTFYRVRLGTYPSFDDAVKAKAEFERKVSKIAYVTKL
jgi:DedD protein